MEVVPITLIISLWLVLVFVIFFLQEHARGRTSSAERDSLLPLAEETPRTLGAVGTSSTIPAGSAHASTIVPEPDHASSTFTRPASRLSESHS